MVEVSLCMGSSCFARGNDLLLAALEGAIKKNGWEDKILLSGARCENRCGEGPNLTVDGVLYQGLDEGAFMDLIMEKMGLPSPRESGRIFGKNRERLLQ